MFFFYFPFSVYLLFLDWNVPVLGSQVSGLSSSWPSITCCNKIHSQLHSRAFPLLQGRSPAGMPSFTVSHRTCLTIGWTVRTQHDVCYCHRRDSVSLYCNWCLSHTGVQYVLTVDSLHCRPFMKTPFFKVVL